jgi:hypothetical protein
MTFIELLVAALATWQAVEVWHHGQIFAGWRSDIQTWDGARWWGWTGWLADLLTCPFCTSVWVGCIAVFMLACPYAAWAAYGLAVSRLANSANDWTYGITRTPKTVLADTTGTGQGETS